MPLFPEVLIFMLSFSKSNKVNHYSMLRPHGVITESIFVLNKTNAKINTNIFDKLKLNLSATIIIDLEWGLIIS